MLILAVPAFFILSGLPDDAGAQSYIALLTSLALFICYEGLQVAAWGRTVGKCLAGIKVIRAADGGAPGWGKSFLRSAIVMYPAVLGVALGTAIVTTLDAYWLDLIDFRYALLSSPIVLVSGLMWLRQRQRYRRPDDSKGYLVDGYLPWHDRAAGTLVVRQ